MTTTKPPSGDMDLTERRLTGGEVRVETSTTDLRAVIRGVAVVFGVLSEDLGGFREIIQPEAITRTLDERIDLRAYVDHDPSKILGRISAGTLRVQADPRGLRVEIDPPNTTAGRDIVESLRRRDVSGMSFAFQVMPNGVDWKSSASGIVRHVTDMRVREVSVVSQPAYVETNVGVAQRALNAFRNRKSVAMLLLEHRQKLASWR